MPGRSGSLRVVLVAQELRAQHRRQRERNRGRNQDGRAQGDGKLPKQPARDVAHEQQGNEHRDQRYCQRHDGEADLFRAFQGRGKRRFSLLHVARDVFDHDDRIVHHETRGYGERHQGQVVEAEAHRVHRRESAHQGQGNRDAGNDRGGECAQEHEDDRHHQRDAEHQLEFHVGDRCADGGSAVRQHRDLDDGRNRRAQLRQQRLDAVDYVDDIGAGLPLDVHDHRGHLFIHADSWLFSTPSITFDTSLSMTGAPLR